MSARPNDALIQMDDPDSCTIRMMISTDNHLGYLERDPIRGVDSFAAFEEVLSLARKHKCDMVVLSGDLFHDNKPSRRTLFKTMEILSKYCMGPESVEFEIVSDQRLNFRSSLLGSVNYENENYSVDLPVFSIHGNHDDPTREGGTEMLAALDLLAVANLVNYFGRQDEVDKVEISPVLMRKGGTKVALYGMGSMRDERLNRMWQSKKVRFLHPREEEGESPWFNMFTLHQNRDLGRGSKNCVHESMIPEFMDLVLWGHEHECLIEPAESLVGTFRISQPGSTVATSLTDGEAVSKHCALLDIRQEDGLNNFRLTPIPLNQVRSFAMAEMVLQDQTHLHPDDPKIDDKICDALAEKVTQLIEQARQNSPDTATQNTKYKIQHPNQVLVRLRVDHSGFSALNNQRFGARFVGDIANPSDILLFHRRRQIHTHNLSNTSNPNVTSSNLLPNPLNPQDLELLNIEDLIKDNLESNHAKLQIIDDKRLGDALTEFVEKEQRQAIEETLSLQLKKQQKKLITRGASTENQAKITTQAAVREVCQQESERVRAERMQEEEEEAKKKLQKEKRNVLNDSDSDDVNDTRRTQNDQSMDASDEDHGTQPPPPRSYVNQRSTTKKPTKTTTTKTSTFSDDDIEITKLTKRARKTDSQSTSRVKRKTATEARSDSDEDVPPDDDSDVVPPPTKRTKRKAPPTTTASRTKRRNATENTRYTYNDEDSDVPPPETAPSPPTRKSPRKINISPTSSAGTKPSLFASSSSNKRAKRGRRAAVIPEIQEDSDDDEYSPQVSGSVRLSGSGWGTAATGQRSKRARYSRRL